MLRNIYESLISGYLYHKSGRECWLDPNGKPYLGAGAHFRGFMNWPSTITFSVPASNQTSTPRVESMNRPTGRRWPRESLCAVLARTPEAIGMRIYIEFLFRSLYKRDGFLEQLALMQDDETFQQRSFVLCFDDLTSPDDDLSVGAMQQALDFWFPNGTDGPNPREILLRNSSSEHANHSGHSTTHDATIRSDLKTIIMTLDCEYYNGQIAFMDLMIPCGHA